MRFASATLVAVLSLDGTSHHHNLISSTVTSTLAFSPPKHHDATLSRGKSSYIVPTRLIEGIQRVNTVPRDEAAASNALFMSRGYFDGSDLGTMPEFEDNNDRLDNHPIENLIAGEKRGRFMASMLGAALATSQLGIVGPAGAAMAITDIDAQDVHQLSQATAAYASSVTIDSSEIWTTSSHLKSMPQSLISSPESNNFLISSEAVATADAAGTERTLEQTEQDD